MAPVYVLQCRPLGMLHGETRTLDVYFASFGDACAYLHNVKRAYSADKEAWSWTNGTHRWNVLLLHFVPSADAHNEVW